MNENKMHNYEQDLIIILSPVLLFIIFYSIFLFLIFLQFLYKLHLSFPLLNSSIGNFIYIFIQYYYFYLSFERTWSYFYLFFYLL